MLLMAISSVDKSSIALTFGTGKRFSLYTFLKSLRVLNFGVVISMYFACKAIFSRVDVKDDYNTIISKIV